MPTYVYECTRCERSFEVLQAMSDARVPECPECGGEARRTITAGAGVIVKGGGASHSACSLEARGRTCCGRDERCGHPPCKE